MMNQIFIFIKDTDHKNRQNNQQMVDQLQANFEEQLTKNTEELTARHIKREEKKMQVLKNEIIYGVAKAVMSPVVASAVAKEVKQDMVKLDEQLHDLEQSIQKTNEAFEQ